MRIVTSNDNTVATLPRTVQNATERPPKKPLPPSSGSEASATTTTKDVVKLNCQVCRLEINRAWFFDAGDQSLTLRSSPSSGYQVIFTASRNRGCDGDNSANEIPSSPPLLKDMRKSGGLSMSTLPCGELLVSYVADGHCEVTSGGQHRPAQNARTAPVSIVSGRCRRFSCSAHPALRIQDL